MSRLSDLKQKIEKIPQQNAAVESAAMLIRQSGHIEKIRNDFELAVLHIATLGEYKELNLGTEKQKLTQFLNSVKTIKAQFEDFENFRKLFYQNWLEKNKDVSSQVITNLKLKWTNHVQNHLNKYKSIMDLANNAKLPGAKKMSQELSDIAIAFENIPSELSQIKSFEKSLSQKAIF